MIRSSVELSAIARRASAAFLEDGTELDKEIAKLAGEHDLTRIQIQRVVEDANHQTNSFLYKQAGEDERTFTFKVASVEGVLSRLNTGHDDHEKVAELRLMDAVRSVIGKTRPAVNFEKTASQMAAVDPREIEIRKGQALTGLSKISGWITAHSKALGASRVGVYEDIRTTMSKISTLAKNHVNSGQRFSDLYKLACNYDRDSQRIWEAAFSQVREGLMKLGAPISNMVKNDQLPQEIPYEVINGNHALLIGLDSLKNKISEEDRYSSRLKLMDTYGPAVVSSITHIRNSADVQKHLSNTVEKVAAIAHNMDLFLEEMPELIELLKEAGFIGKGVKAMIRNPKKTVLGVGGTVGIAGLGYTAYQGGKSVKEETRDYHPGAYRGTDMGGTNK